MRSILLGLTLLFLSTNALAQDALPSSEWPINTVVGDISFVETYGHLPNPDTDEQLRIDTHLAYIEDKLRNADTSHLTPKLLQKRLQALDFLRSYHQRGLYPVNDDHPDLRRPTFLDQNQKLCAVGAMIGREASEKLAETHKYDYIRDIPPGPIDQWARENGFTVHELSTIQPGYVPSARAVTYACKTDKDAKERGTTRKATQSFLKTTEEKIQRLDLTSCTRQHPGIQHLDLDITPQGYATRIRHQNQRAPTCFRKALQHTTFPTHCGLPRRFLRLSLQEKISAAYLVPPHRPPSQDPTETHTAFSSGILNDKIAPGNTRPLSPKAHVVESLSETGGTEGSHTRSIETFDPRGNLIRRSTYHISAEERGKPIQKSGNEWYREKFFYRGFQVARSSFESLERWVYHKEACTYTYANKSDVLWKSRSCRITLGPIEPCGDRKDLIRFVQTTTRTFNKTGEITQEEHTRKVPPYRGPHATPDSPHHKRTSGTRVLKPTLNEEGNFDTITTSEKGIWMEFHPGETCI